MQNKTFHLFFTSESHTHDLLCKKIENACAKSLTPPYYLQSPMIFFSASRQLSCKVCALDQMKNIFVHSRPTNAFVEAVAAFNSITIRPKSAAS
jgi:hypothetical protein